MINKTLPELLSKEPVDISAVADHLELLLDRAVQDINSNFGPRRFGKLMRSQEPLPIHTRQLSSYRTRIGMMLEYAVSTSLDHVLRQEYEGRYILTFAPANEYPDFYLRDNQLSTLLKIEMKAVDADSDEQAARFSTPTSLIDSRGDLLLLVAWKWHLIVGKEGRPLGEYPHIFACTILPAGDIAQERDVRLVITGGKIVDGEVLVPSSKNEGFVADPGNYGKFWRLVHESRREAPDLSPSVRKLIAFMEKVELQAPRNRMASSRRKGR